MSKYKICVYAISKNEEKFVSRWVDSMKEADDIYVLDTGSTGPTAGLNAYGGRYSDTAQTLNLTIGSQVQIPLATTLPNLNTTYATANSITVLQAGTYEINYFSNMTALLQLQSLWQLEIMEQIFQVQ